MDALIIYVDKDGYSPNQVSGAITVGELIEELQRYDEDMPIYTAFDNAYTYGTIRTRSIRQREFDEDDDE